MSSFTQPQVVPNLYECLCSAEHKGRYFEESGKQSSSGAPLTSKVFYFPTMEVNGAPKQPGYKLSSKYLPLCSAEQRHSYRFGTTWGRVNDDRFFGWTIPLIIYISLLLLFFILGKFCFFFCTFLFLFSFHLYRFQFEWFYYLNFFYFALLPR